MKYFNAKKPVGTACVGIFFILFGVLFEPFVAPDDYGLAKLAPRIVLGAVLVVIGLMFLVKGLGTYLIARRRK